MCFALNNTQFINVNVSNDNSPVTKSNLYSTFDEKMNRTFIWITIIISFVFCVYYTPDSQWRISRGGG